MKLLTTQPNLSNTIQHLLEKAKYLTITPAGRDPIEAIHLCFQILALNPEHREAKDLIYHAICDPWLINRIHQTINHQVEEWDDRPWQQQHRLALSYRLISRWPGYLREHQPGNEIERDGPADVRHLLLKGQRKLSLPDQQEAVVKARNTFSQALAQSQTPQDVLLWVAKCLAREAYFSEATATLATLLSRFPDFNKDVLLLQAELCWWRDNQYRIPWLPAVSGDGSYYERLSHYRSVSDFASIGLLPLEPNSQPTHEFLLDESDISQLPGWVRELLTHNDEAGQQTLSHDLAPTSSSIIE